MLLWLFVPLMLLCLLFLALNGLVVLRCVPDLILLHVLPARDNVLFLESGRRVPGLTFGRALPPIDARLTALRTVAALLHVAIETREPVDGREMFGAPAGLAGIPPIARKATILAGGR